MRLFLAINLAPDLRDALHVAVAPLRAVAPHVSWTPVERLHLTVKFLGEQHAELEARLIPALDAAAARHEPMRLDLRGIGAFPGFARPRVVWVGIEPCATLDALFRDVEDACAAAGLARDDRAFSPHVTLGRTRPRTPRAEVHALADAAKRVAVEGSELATTLDVMESVTTRARHCYVTRHRARLIGAREPAVLQRA